MIACLTLRLDSEKIKYSPHTPSPVVRFSLKQYRHWPCSLANRPLLLYVIFLAKAVNDSSLNSMLPSCDRVTLDLESPDVHQRSEPGFTHLTWWRLASCMSARCALSHTNRNLVTSHTARFTKGSKNIAAWRVQYKVAPCASPTSVLLATDFYGHRRARYCRAWRVRSVYL